MARLGTSLHGLSEEDVRRRRDEFGRNILPEPARRTVVAVLLDQFRSPFIYLLLAAAMLSVSLGEYTDATFILIVLAANATVGTYQEWGAERRIRGLQLLVRSVVGVRRDGVPREIDGRDLVPGDIVGLTTGLKLSADMRVLNGQDLVVDESMLSGESTPIQKRPEPPVPAEAPLGDRVTMLHAGTPVLSGRGTAVVVATGPATQIGRIAASLAAQSSVATPLVRRMAGFTRFVSVAVAAIIALLAAVEIVRGAPATDILLIAVALAVSAIPEGLPVAMTVALSLAVHRMARRNVIVRRLPAVEGLGACTVIASDKTGTLTLNQLTVAELWLPGIGRTNVQDERASALAASAALCNEASLGPGDVRDGACGDTVDVAFLWLARELGALEQARRAPVVAVIPYEPELRFAASFVAELDGGVVAHVKGAAETVLPMCGSQPVAASAAAVELADAGYRVIAVAAGPVRGTTANCLRNLTLLGFAAIIDPLRPDVPAAIAIARRAGIRVCMVTGDHPRTALAIARDLGLAQSLDEVVTGADLLQLDEAEMLAAVARAGVFARVEPLQKLRIVQALQQAGHIVAVTGDGVNDAPALRAADIGVAMAGNGTDVAREAADILLVDDNFASIVAGVEVGRFAYDNIRKVIYLVISTGAAEIVLFVLAVLAGLPPPLTAVQLLWLNLVTNGIQDVALAFERGEPGVLLRPPRSPRQPIFNRRMVAQTALSGVVVGTVCYLYYDWMLSAGVAHVAAQNALLWLLVCFENAHCLNCRSETRSVFRIPLTSNVLLVSGILLAQGMQVLAMSVPLASDVLGIAPLPFDQWLLLVALALSVIPLMELYKVALRRGLLGPPG